MTDDEMIITLHDIARDLEVRDPVYGKEIRIIADRLSELSKAERTAQHKAIQG